MSKLTVLVTTMHQTDAALYKRMNLQTDAVIANQASDNWERTEQIDGNMVKVVTTDTRGLSKNRNIALSREKILCLVWAFDYEGDTRTVDVHVQKLRQKLELKDRIRTIYKVGYRFEV